MKLTTKQAYFIENNPHIQDLIQRLDCHLIEDKESKKATKISARVNFWFQSFSTTQKDIQIGNNVWQ